MGQLTTPPSDDSNSMSLGKFEQSADKQIVVTIDPRKFADVLEDIVGHREEIRKAIKADFTIDIQSLIQFHNILTHKISTQNKVNLLLFSAEISFPNEFRRTIHTVDALSRFFEHSKVEPLGVELRWELLIDFNEQQRFQRQTIRIVFLTESGAYGEGARLKINIEHTNQLWAGEVLALFIAQFEHCKNHYSKPYLFCIRFRTIYKYYIWAVFACFAFAGTTYAPVAQNYYITKDDQILFSLARAVSESDKENRPQALAQYFLVMHAKNTKQSEHMFLINQLREKKFFEANIEEVFRRAEAGVYDKLLLIESTHRQVLAGIGVLFIVSLVIGIGGAAYLVLFRQPSFILLTDVAVKRRESSIRFRKISFEIAFWLCTSVIGVAAAFGVDKLLKFGARIIT